MSSNKGQGERDTEVSVDLNTKRKVPMQLTSAQGLGTLTGGSSSAAPSANVYVPAIALQSRNLEC